MKYVTVKDQNVYFDVSSDLYWDMRRTLWYPCHDLTSTVARMACAPDQDLFRFR